MFSTRIYSKRPNNSPYIRTEVYLEGPGEEFKEGELCPPKLYT